MISVILATHNGADTIGRTLQALCDVAEPAGGWELLVVNNASTDDTVEILRRYSGGLPLRLLEEPRLGKSNALNTAIADACGDLIVFTDDDVVPAHDWLVEWRRVADRNPTLDLFGGAIVAEFEAAPPPWLRETSWMLMLYAVTTPTLGEGAFPPRGAEIFGPNMAVRAEVLKRGLRFDPGLMQGTAGLLGDETDFVQRAVRQGARLGFAPSARVRHLVNREQVTWRWMLRRFYRHGRTLYRGEAAAGGMALACIAGVPRYLYRRIVTQSLRLPLALASGNRQHLMSVLRTIAYDLGAVRQARLMAREHG